LQLGNLFLIDPSVCINGLRDLIDVGSDAADLHRKLAVVGEVNIIHLTAQEHYERVNVKRKTGLLHLRHNFFLFLRRRSDNHLNIARTVLFFGLRIHTL